MNIVRLGERPTFAWTAPLCAAVVCAALTGCSAGSAGLSALGGSGGNPLGEGQPSGSSSSSSSGGGSGEDASSPSQGSHPDASTTHLPLAPPPGEVFGHDPPGPSDAAVDTRASEDTGSPLTTFTLLNTNVTTLVDGEPLLGFDPIAENATIDIGKLGTALSIRANTTPAVVGSVDFVLDGTYTHTENAVPYVLCSDNGNGTITACPLTVGPHTLVVTPYSGANLADAASPSTTLYFTVVDTADGGLDAAKD